MSQIAKRSNKLSPLAIMELEKTIASLAILKVHLDEYGADYLDHLLPFVRFCIASNSLQVVSASSISSILKSEFGLKVPDYVCDTALRRLVKKHGYLKRESNAYVVVKDLDISTFRERRDTITTNVSNIISDLQTYGESEFSHNDPRETWERALLGFLSRYTIDCVKSYSKESPLPDVEIGDKEQKLIYIIARRLEILRTNEDPLWDEFASIVKGRMLANALVCEDLSSISQKFEKTHFYIDTPIALSLLGLDEECITACSRELIDIIHQLKGKCFIFSHSLAEAEKVISAAAKTINNATASSRVVLNARRLGFTASDLELFRAKLEAKLNAYGILRVSAPPYKPEYQVCEEDLAEEIKLDVRHRNPGALDCDVNSVRSIFALRKCKEPYSLETSEHVFVTSNTALARASWRFAKKQSHSARVSPVISDYSLVNIAWLKLPMNAPNIADIELMASCYAAMEPKEPLWDRYHAEIERLKQRGDITAEDHYLLRHSPGVQLELMDLTQGLETSLTVQTVTEILNNVKADLTAESRAEAERHRIELETKNNVLASALESHNTFKTFIENRCGQISRAIIAIPNFIAIFLVSVATLAGFSKLHGFWISAAITFTAIYSLINAIWGHSLIFLGRKAQEKTAAYLISFFSQKP